MVLVNWGGGFWTTGYVVCTQGPGHDSTRVYLEDPSMSNGHCVTNTTVPVVNPGQMDTCLHGFSFRMPH